jgi:hypothetical protein
MKKATLFTLVLVFALSGNLFAQANQTFCVAGVSNGVGWSWGIIINGGLQSRAVVPPVPAGGGCAALTAAFVASINAIPGGCTAKVAAGNPCCFTICCPQGFDFWIGDAAGNPAGARCKVTGNPAGCAFNPLVIQTTNPDVSTACPVVGDAEPVPDTDGDADHDSEKPPLR